MDRKPYERKLIKADGTVVDYPPAGKQYTLKELQAAVGGFIEIVPLKAVNYFMVINEDGKLYGLPQNRLATEIYDNPNDEIVGDALVCHDRDID